mmetsp:Transcript_22095/g.50602  ORF Transcript_22095/g.50602 Transcript_22095/m.50602 type:complete len:89 (+) Transcript_22095:511-777(+)
MQSSWRAEGSTPLGEDGERKPRDEPRGRCARGGTTTPLRFESQLKVKQRDQKDYARPRAEIFMEMMHFHDSAELHSSATVTCLFMWSR